MITKEFQGKQLSLLGFGAMRLPTHADRPIDEAQVAEMTAYAIDHGVNYFDTAYVYPGSEAALGEILEKNNKLKVKVIIKKKQTKNIMIHIKI